MYLSFSTKLNIAFAVGQLSKQNADPKVSHLKAAKQVMQYFKGTMHLSITYKAGINSREDQLSYGLVGYTNSN